MDRGFYIDQLRVVWEQFPKNQVMIWKTEHLREKPDETLKQICDFLGLSDFGTTQAKDVHSRPYESKISNKERDYLTSVYEPSIRELERELGWQCDDWMDA